MQSARSEFDNLLSITICNPPLKPAHWLSIISDSNVFAPIQIISKSEFIKNVDFATSVKVSDDFFGSDVFLLIQFIWKRIVGCLKSSGT